MKTWIVVASKDHIDAAVKGGFIQAGHGKETAVRRFKKDDALICYSPKLRLGGKEPCQCFTAYGIVEDAEVFQVTQSKDFKPFRRKVAYHSATSASIKPLIAKLSFIKNKASWGYTFRFGVFAISEEDGKVIRRAMKV